MNTFIFKIIIILVMMCNIALAKDNEIYITLDKSTKSNIIRSELTRNWVGGVRVNDGCYALDNKLTELNGLIFLIDINNPNEREKYKVSSFARCPSYKISIYGQLEEFPEEMYLTSSFPLLTVYSLSKNHENEIPIWMEECRESINQYNYEHTQKIITWAMEKGVDLFNFKTLDGETLEQALIRKFGEDDTFPKYELPKTSPPPRIVLFPWQKQEYKVHYYSICY